MTAYGKVLDMEYQKDRAWLEVDLGRIRQNFLNIRRNLPDGTDIIAVIKADAYGLGALPVAKALEDVSPPLLAVATIEEAMSLRENGIRTPIMLMGPMPAPHLELAVDNDIHMYLVSARYARQVSEQASAMGKTAKGHLVIDVGLGRFGIPVKDGLQSAIEEIQSVLKLPSLHVVAITAHLTGSSMVGGQALDRYQGELFKSLALLLKQAGHKIQFHLLSTTPFLHMPEYCFDYIRAGSLFLGLVSVPELDILPAVSLKTVICQTKQLERGAFVSYGPNFTTLRPTKTAVVPIGYADGLRRNLSNRGDMLIRGKKAPIIGKICCDFTILDITDCPEADVGDVVTIFGRDGAESQSVSTYAALSSASEPEVTSIFGRRIPRFYC